MDSIHVTLPDRDATSRLGHALADQLFPGAVVGLIGPLGAGKTHLVRAIAEGLGIADARVVTSPTFVLVQEYQARLPIFHFDTYRLHSPAEFLDLGAHEYFDAGGVCLIEWADRVAQCLPPDRLSVIMEVRSESVRDVVLEAHGPKHLRITRALATGQA